jgi:hypothetical protein
LIFPEINLVLQSIGRVEDGFDDGVYDFAAMHADADFVADFGLFGRHLASLSDGVFGARPGKQRQFLLSG